MTKHKKGYGGMVYSTKPDYEYNNEHDELMETLPPSQQFLHVALDRKHRKGKVVTLITGFKGKKEDVKELGKTLKIFCGSGGSVGESEILVQGDFREKILLLLQHKGYQVKQKG